jgi:hypothetical protein
MAEGSASKLFVVPSELDGIAALGATFSAAEREGGGERNATATRAEPAQTHVNGR